MINAPVSESLVAGVRFSSRLRASGVGPAPRRGGSRSARGAGACGCKGTGDRPTRFCRGRRSVPSAGRPRRRGGRASSRPRMTVAGHSRRLRVPSRDAELRHPGRNSTGQAVSGQRPSFGTAPLQRHRSRTLLQPERGGRRRARAPGAQPGTGNGCDSNKGGDGTATDRDLRRRVVPERVSSEAASHARPGWRTAEREARKPGNAEEAPGKTGTSEDGTGLTSCPNHGYRPHFRWCGRGTALDQGLPPVPIPPSAACGDQRPKQ
jgi:hypothetical protein